MRPELPAFEAIPLTRPDLDALLAQYHEVLHGLAGPGADHEALLWRWEGLRRQFYDWSSLAHLKFSQDTQDERYKAHREWTDGVKPTVQELDVQIKRALLDPPARERLTQVVGEHAFKLWEADIAAFAPELKPLMVEESARVSEYVALTAAAQVQVMGQTYSLSDLRALDNDASRQVRLEASRARWRWVHEHEQELDGLYEQLVSTRHAMAQALGEQDYIPLGYKNMHRIDYTQEDVARFRHEVRQVVVPLIEALYARRAERLGVDRVMAWDETVHDLEGNPSPQGDHDWMVARAQEMFDAMHPELGRFFALMAGQGYMDLRSRKGKAGGGFCTSFAQLGMPFIFANFNGSKGDVTVFTHEMGHAFQNYKSAGQALSDYHWPTHEAAEIHSMSLEFLTWPHMDRFFCGEAARFRQIHLADGLAFLPYGVAVDHFQHMVYAQPQASASQRRQWWAELEAMYLPWRQWGELDEVAAGRRWQLQAHIYGAPFYYIDYTLAQTCALQLWAKMQHDPEGVMQTYVALCERGGQAPFGELVRGAGLRSPFEPGSLRQAVELARVQLGLG